MTLKWEKVNINYTYELKYRGEEEPQITKSTDSEELMVMHLSPGTNYLFTHYTVFKDLKSSGYSFTNVTSQSVHNFSQPTLTCAVLV